MKKYVGKSVNNLIAIGNAVFYEHKKAPLKTPVSNINTEIDRVKEAFLKVNEELQELYSHALSSLGEEGAAIFESYKLLLNDVSYVSDIISYIAEHKVSAEFSVFTISTQLSERLKQTARDEYLKARSEDIISLSERILKALNYSEEIILIKPSILIIDNITPNELMALDKNNLSGLVITQGSLYSHSMILAKMMNIPAMVIPDLDLKKLIKQNISSQELICIVNGLENELVIRPTKKYSEYASLLIEEYLSNLKLLEKYKGLENITKDGRSVTILANISSIEDAQSALYFDCAGVGLYRTEFLYINRLIPPSEDEQVLIYSQILKVLKGKPLVVRTLDIGSDKDAPCLAISKAKLEDPYYRGIRICFDIPHIFRAQLRALLRAASLGDIEILYPMIMDASEIKKINELVKDISKELENENIPYRIPKQGIMIETPESYKSASKLALLTDFFSIGTNDLIQYTFNINRDNPIASSELSKDSIRDELLTMIQNISDCAHKANIPCCICGEAASDISLTAKYLDMGIDYLSVVPGMILPLRQHIRRM